MKIFQDLEYQFAMQFPMMLPLFGYVFLLFLLFTNLKFDLCLSRKYSKREVGKDLEQTYQNCQELLKTNT